jgi:hypothetical protein
MPRTAANLLVVVACHSQVAAQARSSVVESLSVVTESRDSVALLVEYALSPLPATNARMVIEATMDDSVVVHCSRFAEQVRLGRQTVRVQLKMRQKSASLFDTDAIRVQLFVGCATPVAQRSFGFLKTWTQPGSTLLPIYPLNVIGPGGRRPPESQPANVSNSRILADGHVVIRSPDGTLTTRGCGTETVAKPGEHPVTRAFAQSQSPSPPAAAPLGRSKEWLAYNNDRLIGIISDLVGGDASSVQNFLSREPDDLRYDLAAP